MVDSNLNFNDPNRWQVIWRPQDQDYYTHGDAIAENQVMPFTFLFDDINSCVDECIEWFVTVIPQYMSTLNQKAYLYLIVGNLEDGSISELTKFRIRDEVGFALKVNLKVLDATDPEHIETIDSIPAPLFDAAVICSVEMFP